MASTRAAGRLSLVGIAGMLFLSDTAWAQAPTPGSDKVAAQALFEDGRALAAAGKYTDACPKFAESERLDPSPSTLLNLANCWEKLGRTATAWATYREAESAASAAKRPDYMDTAERHARTLVPVLARLTIAVQQPIEGLQVKRDGVLVGSAEWGAAIPIDAGSHTLEASAPGYKAWATKVDVTHDGAQVAVTVPPLEGLPVEAPGPAVTSASAPTNPVDSPSSERPPPQLPEERTSGASTQRTVGLVVGGAGLVGVGVSGVFALIANGKKQDSLGNCRPDHPNQCNANGVSLRNDARSAGDVATVAVVAGGVALATGAVVWLMAPRDKTPTDRGAARVFVAPALNGVIVQGAW